MEASRKLRNFLIVTTDEILTETLNYFAESGKHFRRIVWREVENILLDQKVEIIEASHEHFLDGFDLYGKRFDKGYSLADCISMNVCRELKISDILTHDDHFEQEGFVVLL